MTQNLQNIRTPLVALSCVLSLVSIITCKITWFGIGNELVKQQALSALSSKQTLAMLIALACLGITALSAALAKKWITFFNIPLTLYLAILILNQRPDESVRQLIELSVQPTYWIAMISTVGVMVLSGIIGIKGFASGVPKE